MPKVRVRFAPSPTGPLHIGGVRTALINFLFARKHEGDFILRIEDTDRNRFEEGAEEYIIDSLTWCGLVPDEGPLDGGPYGPYRQSERKDIYAGVIDKLISTGNAYYAFDTVEELDEMRRNHEQQGIQGVKYDASSRLNMRNSLTLSEQETTALLANGTAFTVRMKIGPGEEIGVHDLIRGEISFMSDTLDDKVLLKADGLPTYHLANVVDDHMMKVSHVIRGEEWLSSTAHHILLYRILGWIDTMPAFAHLPLILKPTGKGKLSKRDGANFGFPIYPLRWIGTNIEDYAEGFREAGFDPEAFINFLALLGWNPGTDQEIFHRDELMHAFDLNQVTKSGARFDYDKAKWFNAQYIQEKEDIVLAGILQGLFPETYGEVPASFLREFCALLKERVTFYTDFLNQGTYFFHPPQAYEEKIITKKWDKENAGHYRAIVKQLNGLQAFTAESVEQAIKSYIADHELRFGDILPVLRNAISGVTQGPDLFRVIALLGKDESLTRLESAILSFDEISKSQSPS